MICYRDVNEYVGGIGVGRERPRNEQRGGYYNGRQYGLELELCC